MLLISGKGLDAESMDALGYKACKCLINHAMPHYLRFSAKLRACNTQAEMATTGITCMAGMHGAIVLDFQQRGFQACKPATYLFS